MRTRHIPVYVVSTDDLCGTALQRGALGALPKPISRDQLEDLFKRIHATLNRKNRTALVIESPLFNADNQAQLKKELGAQLTIVKAVKDLPKALERREFDALLVDCSGSNSANLTELSKFVKNGEVRLPPLIAYADRAFPRKLQGALKQIVSQTPMRQVEDFHNLLNETAMVLRISFDQLTEERRNALREQYKNRFELAEKRSWSSMTIFAISSR